MNKELSQKILAIQESALEDETYHQLMQEHENRNEQFLAVMEQLNREQQAAVYDYLGVLVQMHYRLMKLACN